jgi:putative endonuclease
MSEQATSRTIGKQGEDFARQYLEKKNMRLVRANWACKFGEIDLVMKDNQTIVFVEVRLRRPTSYGEGLDTVSWQKHQNLLRTARLYQQATNYWGDIRFDVVSITRKASGQLDIEHIEHAFGEQI